MARYVIRIAKAEGLPEPAPPQVLPHPMVYPTEAVKTGLVDRDGNDIWRLQDEIGFLPRLAKDHKA